MGEHVITETIRTIVTLDTIELPENPTNGDMLISLYPNLKYTIQNGRVVTTIGVASSFDLEWWNTPYKRG